MSGLSRSGYSANEKTGEATQTSGTKKPSHARDRRMTSCLPLRFLTTLTPRLRWPCGAPMATIAMLAARITAFAIHGFIVDHSSPVKIADLFVYHPPDVGRNLQIALDTPTCPFASGSINL